MKEANRKTKKDCGWREGGRIISPSLQLVLKIDGK